jgi:hypothetical protein
VARANMLQSETSQSPASAPARARALAAYSEFLTLWKDADPDLPILHQAKAEYAKLRAQPITQANPHYPQTQAGESRIN